LCRRSEIRLLREVDDGTAVGALGEMRERLLLLVRRQSVLGEGAELICVGVVAGLEELGHWLSGAA
jgi:hypothetical protein